MAELAVESETKESDAPDSHSALIKGTPYGDITLWTAENLLITLQEEGANLLPHLQQKKQALAYGLWDYLENIPNNKKSNKSRFIAKYCLFIVLRLDIPSHQDDATIDQYAWLTSPRLCITRLQREAIFGPDQLIKTPATDNTLFQWLQFSYLPEALMIIIRAIKRGKRDVEFWGALTNAIAWGAVNLVVFYLFPGPGFVNALLNLSLFVFDIIHDIWRDQQKVWNAEALYLAVPDNSKEKSIFNQQINNARFNRDYNTMIAMGIALGMLLFFMPSLFPSYTLTASTATSAWLFKCMGASLAVIFGAGFGGLGRRLYKKYGVLVNELNYLYKTDDRLYQAEIALELTAAIILVACGGLFTGITAIALASPMIIVPLYTLLCVPLAFISIRALVSSLKTLLETLYSCFASDAPPTPITETNIDLIELLESKNSLTSKCQTLDAKKANVAEKKDGTEEKSELTIRSSMLTQEQKAIELPQRQQNDTSKTTLDKIAQEQIQTIFDILQHPLHDIEANITTLDTAHIILKKIKELINEKNEVWLHRCDMWRPQKSTSAAFGPAIQDVQAPNPALKHMDTSDHDGHSSKNYSPQNSSLSTTSFSQ